MDDRLTQRLDEAEREFDETVRLLADPDVLSDSARLRRASQRHAELKQIVERYRDYRSAVREAADASELLAGEADPEMVEYLNRVVAEKRAEAAEAELDLQGLVVPKDPNDEKDVIVEIRAAAGGDEATLWAGDLYRMYGHYAERHGWVVDPIAVAGGESGGLKEATFAVKGKGAYSRFKFEAGPHRVQRVPKTESQGRVHTSVATVAVLPEADEVEVELSDADLEIDTFRSTGPGGQSVNTTDSAVRIKHLPSGIVVSCQDEKSQLQNKLKAMRVLRARLYQQQMDEQLGERASVRRAQVRSGERSEKIRTYNFKENRVTDHRVGLTVHSLGDVLEGDLDQLHDALAADEAARLLASNQ